MLATLRQRDFALLWFAGLISMMGNHMLAVALPIVVYAMTGSALAIGGMLLANMLPGILFGSVAGVLVDRWERRRTMVIVNLLLALSILPLLLVQSADMLWLVYAIGFVQGTLSKFFAPAENAMLPLLSNPKYLVMANALNALNNNLARLIGPAVGGLLVAAIDLGGVVLIDALTYIVAAALAALISVTSHPGQANPHALSPRRFAVEWLDGLRLIRRTRVVWIVLIFTILTSISESIMYVLFVPFFTEILHADTAQIGALVSVQAVGGIVGGVVLGWFAARVRPARLLGIGAVGMGLADLVLFHYPLLLTSLVPAFALFVVAGPFSVGVRAGYSTLVQAHTGDAYRGRVFSTLNMIGLLFGLAGIGLAGVGGEALGIIPTIRLEAFLYILAGLVCLVALRERSAALA